LIWRTQAGLAAAAPQLQRIVRPSALRDHPALPL
jgi:hypothetical protein